MTSGASPGTTHSYPTYTGRTPGNWNSRGSGSSSRSSVHSPLNPSSSPRFLRSDTVTRRDWSRGDGVSPPSLRESVPPRRVVVTVVSAVALARHTWVAPTGRALPVGDTVVRVGSTRTGRRRVRWRWWSVSLPRPPVCSDGKVFREEGRSPSGNVKIHLMQLTPVQ